jgi:RHS repeat-associated protein
MNETYAYDDTSTYVLLGKVLPSKSHKFTGKERDPESGLDNFGARYNSSSMGRFMSPDWSDDSDPIPHADLANPQTLNLYAYVGNNPLNDTDDDGHEPNPAGTCGWLCRFFNLFRNSNESSTEQAGLTPLPLPGPSPMPPFRPPVIPTPPVRPPVVEPPPIPPVVAVGGLIVIDAALLIYDSYEGYNLYQSYKLSRDKPGTEPTPTTNPKIYEPVKGTPGKRNKITGEIWEKDKFHKNHYEVYKNKKDYENGQRDRSVWEDGRLKEKF